MLLHLGGLTGHSRMTRGIGILNGISETIVLNSMKFSLDSKAYDLNAQQTALCTPIDSPVEMSQQNPSSDEQFKTPVSNDFKDEEISSDGQVSSNDMKSGDSCEIVKSDLAAPVHSPQRSPEHAKEDATLSFPSQLSLGGDKECSTELVEFKSEASSISVLHSLPKLEAVFSKDEHKLG